MNRFQNNKSQDATLTELLSSHGVRREKKLEAALKTGHLALQKRRKYALYITLIWLLVTGLLLSPVLQDALRQHAWWAMALLFFFVIVELVWALQLWKLFGAWKKYRDLQSMKE